jgi:hypothetical protein
MHTLREEAQKDEFDESLERTLKKEEGRAAIDGFGIANSVAGAIVHAAKRSGVQLAFTSIAPGRDTGIREMRILPDGTPTWSNDAEEAVILRKQPPPKVHHETF